jgi:hypothetical protein
VQAWPDLVERLLRLAASIEEAIILLEQRREGPESARTVVRLRVIQGEILGLIHNMKGDSLPVD